ncbi:hypothetical protein H2200_007242 [Cladophialophora chaetospira]|uniref:Uncharacterized protein n=1 Tax=Cladophialophora chaetospira TaxID=386627 RepID=A0AA38X7M6_9EURO|nr:hypothetical protein H2200_007242 [Cladophialophora chaetospira]
MFKSFELSLLHSLDPSQLPMMYAHLAILITCYIHSIYASFANQGPYPPSYAAFTSTFKEPAIPQVVTNFKSHLIQHKWDENVSHIVTGYMYNSATHGLVRVDEVLDGALGSSLFDYRNASDGSALNKQWLVGPSVGSKPTCFSERVSMPGFPLVTAGILQTNGATFGGVVQDQWVGYAQSWDLLYGGAISVTIYLDVKNVLLGFDFFGPGRRTKVITRFFNIMIGEIDIGVFENFPCK